MATERIIIQVESRGFKRVQRDIRSVRQSAKSGATILQQLRNALVVVAAVRVIRGFTDLADSFINLENRLRSTLGSLEDARTAQAALLKISRETRTGIAATGDAFARLALGAKDLGLSTSTLLGVTRTLNQAIILSGATAQEAQNAMIQLAQGIAAGALRGDELRAVLEQLPLVARLIADEFDVPLGQLRKLGEEGALVTDRIIKAIQGAAPEIQRQFQNTTTTIDQALTVLQTNFTVFVNNLFQATGLATGLVDAIEKLGGVLAFLGENLFIINGLFAGLATAFALKGLFTAGALATRVLGAAFIATAGSTGILTTAFAALRGALIALNATFLLSPIGLIATAVTLGVAAWVAYESATESVDEEIEKNNKLLKENQLILDQNAISSAKVAQNIINEATARKGNAAALLQEARAQLLKTEAENDPLGEFGFIGETDRLQQRVAELERQIDQANDQITEGRKALQGFADEAAKAAAEVDPLANATDKVKDTIADLRFELAQLGRDAEDQEIAEALDAAELDFNSAADGADIIRNLVREIIKAREAREALEDAEEDRLDFINELNDELRTRADVEAEVGAQLEEVRSAVVKLTNDEAAADAFLADKKRELVDAQREELFPELVEFLEDNMTVREQLIEVETEAAKIKRQAVADGLSAARAAEIEAEAIRLGTEAIRENTAARELNDRFFTSESTGREFADFQKRLREEQDAGLVTQERANELTNAYLREAAGASNATLAYAEAQNELNRAVKEGAVTQEEAIDIARQNRIELLESQRTAEAGAERAFLKFVDDATNAAAQTEELFTATFNSLSDELFNFVKNGEFNFNSLVQTIVDGLIRIAVQQAIGGVFGGGAGLFGAAGGGIAGSSGAPGGSAGGFGGLIAGALAGSFAQGGQFTVGSNSALASLPGVDNRLVAFRARDGEEVTVSPRGEGAGGMGSPINIVQNIQAKDADSFKRSEGQNATRAAAVLQRATRRR